MIECFLDNCLEHDGCVVYSCEIDGRVSWESHLPDDGHVLSRLNGSYDTFDRRSSKVLRAVDYPDAVVAEEDSDPATDSKSWWKPWTWR